MELSEEIQNILQKYRHNQPHKAAADNGAKLSDSVYGDEDVIDVEEIVMPDDQTWLFEPEVITVGDLQSWLYEDVPDTQPAPTINHATMVRDKSRKNIDTRTFTRPKKKANRPSIEKYNEELFEKPPSLSDEIDNYISPAEKQPLHFDLSQPTSGNFFDKILSAAPELDSFQNMSPPSLVNSMCSSTFTNLMENSYIKNDPVLREIRDADYSQMIYQDSEPPLFQSFTESCSSINSEVAENFVRKTLTSLNGTLVMNGSMEDSFPTPPLDDSDTFTAQSGDTLLSPNETHVENIDPNIPLNNTHTTSVLNGTFKKDTTLKLREKLNGTFNKIPDTEEKDLEFERKSLKLRQSLNDISQKEREQLNNLEQVNKVSSNKEQNNLNNTFRKEYNNLNRTFDRKKSNLDRLSNHSDDQVNLKRLSAEIDDYLSEKMNDVQVHYGSNNSARLSADSSDSLDRLSNLSNCSRESRIISMADVDALVEQQERSLQVMSTPKPAKSLSRLFENTCLSPIPNLNIKEHLSDSEISSEEYIAGHAAVSGTDRRVLDRNVRSLSNLKNPREMNKPRSIATLPTSNLPPKTTSYGNLRAPESRIRGSLTNLRTMGSGLKGSYTSLRPVNSNLPNIPPPKSIVKSDPALASDCVKNEVFKAPLPPKEQSSNLNGTFVKPGSRISSLPRPVSAATGIPRPMSKIPAPKSARASSASTTGGRSLMRPSSKINLNDGFY